MMQFSNFHICCVKYEYILESEALVNSRSLLELPNYSDDYEPLTPRRTIFY